MFIPEHLHTATGVSRIFAASGNCSMLQLLLYLSVQSAHDRGGWKRLMTHYTRGYTMHYYSVYLLECMCSGDSRAYTY